MIDGVDLQSVLAFLSDLEKNNNKAWFEAHRASYQQARDHFEDFVEELIARLAPIADLTGVSAQDCIFRINRDVRFSKDKSPYKANMGAHITPGGRKSTSLGYYIHIELHDHSFLGGGLHMPTPEQLAKWREAVDQDAARFRQIIEAEDFVAAFGPLEGERLKTAPKGYPKDHPELDLLALKEVTTGRHLTDAEVVAPDIVDRTVQGFTLMKPFIDYLNDIIR
ncbi:MAG: DUF2461 domain-containing protein [Chloroflexi bacterium]|nr:DUF2461 domain-containing protein [Chloroflexota bacterium]